MPYLSSFSGIDSLYAIGKKLILGNYAICLNHFLNFKFNKG